jgi:hypothetical protein
VQPLPTHVPKLLARQFTGLKILQNLGMGGFDGLPNCLEPAPEVRLAFRELNTLKETVENNGMLTEIPHGYVHARSQGPELIDPRIP